ncbi:hypothetical protein BJV82DRAFT_272293 [Fennellomyces sp. T-0311]|nr:hypothetical protein BJV82DRAFT_272293 [Fennellomyces sp. T-0311]
MPPRFRRDPRAHRSKLRSVNDQLRKLPSSRPQTAESMREKDPPSPIRTSRENAEAEIPAAEKLQEKALPSLPPNRWHKENNVYTTQIDLGHTDQPAIDRDIDDYHLATIQRSPTSIPYPHEPVVDQRATTNASSPHLPSAATRTTQPRTPKGLSSPAPEHGRQMPVTAPVVQHPTAGFRVHDEPFPRKGKKKNKHYSVFPFLKKKSDPTDDHVKPRFSLGMLSQKKEEKRSPTSSAHTSPQSVSFPNHTYSTSPVEHRYNTISSRLTLEDGTPVIEYVKAQWSYDAKISSEITFAKNDILAVIEKKGDGWWDAQIVHSDKQPHFARGLVPGNYMATYS